MASPRPTYTVAQLKKYFDLIHLPSKHCHTSIAGLPTSEVLDFLTSLQKHQLVYIPWENLSLHYSQTHQNSLDPYDLYSKIVDGINPTSGPHYASSGQPHEPSNRRGGYCMENNNFFGTVLRSLGFSVYSVGARVRDPVNGYGGWSHMVNLVRLPSSHAPLTDQSTYGTGSRGHNDGASDGDGIMLYLVDVGFGGNGVIAPLPLISGLVQPHIRPAHCQLQYKNVDCNSDPEQRMWTLHWKADGNDDNSPWIEQYCFTTLEFTPSDFKVINHYTSTSRQTFFTWMVVVTRMTMAGAKERSEEGEEVQGAGGEIDGQMILTEGVKRRKHGVTEVLVEKFRSEEQRLDALQTYFGIRFSKQEQAGIIGMASQVERRGIGM